MSDNHKKKFTPFSKKNVLYDIKMAEREHLEELRHDRGLYDRNTSDLDTEIAELEMTNMESEDD